MLTNTLHFLYKNSFGAFNIFRQAKFPDGGLVLGSSQFFNTAPAASKNTARFKNGRNRPKNNDLALLI